MEYILKLNGQRLNDIVKALESQQQHLEGSKMAILQQCAEQDAARQKEADAAAKTKPAAKSKKRRKK